MYDYSADIIKLMNAAGNEVTVKRKNGETFKVKAFLHPLLYKNKLYVEMQPSEVGKTDDGCFRYIGPGNVIFAADDIVEFDGERFVVERFEKVFLFGISIYCWAVARPATGGA